MYRNLYAFAIAILSAFCSNLSAQGGTEIFDDSYIHRIEVQSLEPYSYSEFHDTLYSSHNDVYFLSDSDLKVYFPAKLVIDGTVIDTVGIRYKGNSTFVNARKKYPFKIDFNEFVDGQRYDGINKLNFNSNLLDVTCMRAKLSFEIMERMGIIAPRVAYAEVYINGSYRGIYSMVEQIDKTFVKANFDPENTGYLHKAYSLTVGFPVPGFSGQDTSQSGLHSGAPLKTHKSSENYQPLRDFIVAANTATDQQFVDGLDGQFDITGFITQQAINMVLSDRDHYCSANWNFYMYEDPRDEQWYMLPWDYDLAMGAIKSNLVEDPANEAALYWNSSYLTQRMMSIPELKTQYRNIMCNVMQTGMDSVWLEDRISTLTSLLAQPVQSDTTHWPLEPDFTTFLDEDYVIDEPGDLHGTVISGMRDYIRKRYSQVRQSVAAYELPCNMSTSTDYLLTANEPLLYPNPSSGVVYIESNGGIWPADHATVYNSLGQVVSDIALDSASNRYEINLSGFGTGMFMVRVGDHVLKVVME